MTSPPQKLSLPEPELLPHQPPPAAIRWTAVLLIVIFLTLLATALLVQIPETVRCRFVLISDQGADPIQCPIQATVHLVKTSEGREVQEGEDLFVLRSDEIRSWQTQLLTDQQDLTALQKRIGMLGEYYASQLRIKDEELQQIEREVEFREKHLATTRDFLARNQKLANEKLVSEVEILRHQLEVADGCSSPPRQAEAENECCKRRQQQQIERLKKSRCDHSANG